MNAIEERIEYLTAKAQRGALTPYERIELARLLGKNPNDFQNDNGLNSLIGIALVAIAIAIIADVFSKK